MVPASSIITVFMTLDLQQVNYSLGLWPHLQVPVSPVVGPGATVNTLRLGYPWY
jgi:ureidoglycolate hydrolase